MSIADRIVVMNKGRVEDIGPPSRVYLRPASLFTASFMGESNILSGDVVEATANAAWVKTPVGTITVPAQARIGETVMLSIRPEQLQVGRLDEGAIALGSGRISEISFQGTHLRARVILGPDAGQEMLLRSPAAAALVVGDTAELSVAPVGIVMLRR